VSGLLIFFLLQLLLGHNPLGAVGWFKGFSFDGVYAVGVIGVVCLSYAFFAALWTTFLGDTAGWWRWFLIPMVLLVALILSCVFGGIMWTFLDMLAGFSPEYPRMIRNITGSVRNAFALRPQMAFRSPGMMLSYFITVKSHQIMNDR